MNIQLIKNFNPILKINTQSSNIKLNKIIPNEWLFILMNTGSFTQNLNSLLISDININISQKYNYNQPQQFHNTRTVWLANNNNQRFAFAQSRWIIKNNYTNYLNLLNNKPIGKSFIINETDLHKKIEEIYCGHSYILEKNFQSQQLIWGRKYTLLYNKKSFIVIQEYFSPNLTKFLKFH
uniref:Uncharacterized protein ycf21 n=1 Tax=Antithamnion sp. TaxID=2767 RepID=YCF21_ANTSP|nr:RecName: Full=Uncharacterized protein ycf21 [Antithamnion sp.]CAA45960.1 non-essential secretory protein [Antithamnion sp.]